MNVEDLEGSNIIIWAYDDSRKPVIGIFKAVITVRNIESVTEFTVLDIPLTFTLLLGRPWFHPLGGIPSTVHQKIKFWLNDKVITIPVKTNNIIACLNIVPPDLQISIIHEDWVDPKVATMIKRMQYLPGTGLGGRYIGVTKFS